MKLEAVQRAYPVGSRVEVRFSDLHSWGRGTVASIGDTGISVHLDNGESCLIPFDGASESLRTLVGELTERVLSQILAVRDSGETNMFDIPAVQYLANKNGYHELVVFLIDHQREYLDVICGRSPHCPLPL